MSRWDRRPEMFTSTLPVGTLFAVKQNGQNRVWVLDSVNGRLCYGGVGRPLKTGEVIHRCVFKRLQGDELQSRGTYTLKDGDVSWVDTGIIGFDKKPIFMNKFADTVPVWLR